MEKFPPSELDTHPYFYFPHHCVTEDDSTTTKLRVVFNVSAKTTSGFFLIDCLMVSPNLQNDIFDIPINPKGFKVAMSADFPKLQRQVALTKEDKDFHRNLWRFDDMQPVDTYRMTRCTYGITS